MIYDYYLTDNLIIFAFVMIAFPKEYFTEDH